MGQNQDRQAPPVIAPCSYADVAHFAFHPHRGISDLKDRRGPAQWFTASIDGEVAGCSCLMGVPGRWRICGLFVRPKHRRRGIGAAMIRFLTAFAFNRLGAKVVDANTRETSLFESCQFTMERVFQQGGVMVRRL